MRPPYWTSRSFLVRAARLAVLVAAACGPSIEHPDDGGGGDDRIDGAPTGPRVDARPLADAGPPPFYGTVYAHSSTELYQVDPDTYAISRVAAFDWPDGSDEMTDIAIDEDGDMVGISFSYVYSVDKATGACTRRGTLDRSFNGLSWVPAEEIDPTGEEVLVGAALDGSLWRLDPDTGASTRIGDYGGGYGSSGDLVSVSGFGTVATATSSSSETDVLVRVNPVTGQATPIGSTGVTDIWGLGYWKGKVHGFTEGGTFVLIDVDTGVATTRETGAVAWWGAGVTTSAPIIE